MGEQLVGIHLFFRRIPTSWSPMLVAQLHQTVMRSNPSWKLCVVGRHPVISIHFMPFSPMKNISLVIPSGNKVIQVIVSNLSLRAYWYLPTRMSREHQKVCT